MNIQKNMFIFVTDFKRKTTPLMKPKALNLITEQIINLKSKRLERLKVGIKSNQKYTKTNYLLQL